MSTMEGGTICHLDTLGTMYFDAGEYALLGRARPGHPVHAADAANVIHLVAISPKPAVPFGRGARIIARIHPALRPSKEPPPCFCQERSCTLLFS